MNTYDKLKLHLDEHMFKRGENKGDAPAGKRSKAHYRVVHRVLPGTESMRVRFHKTDVITAWRDGAVRFDTAGWFHSRTTREAIDGALPFLSFKCYGLHGASIMSQKQMTISVKDKYFKYYDSITFNADGEMLTEPRPFIMKRINKAESAELMAEFAVFKEMLPVLHSTCAPLAKPIPYIHERERTLGAATLRGILSDPSKADRWLELIATYKYSRAYDWISREYVITETGSAKACWAAFMAICKAPLYEQHDSTVFSVDNI
jgi:hypothetical protein